MTRLRRIASSFVLTPRSSHVVGLDALDGSLAGRPVVGYPSGRVPVKAVRAGRGEETIHCDKTARPVGIDGTIRLSVPAAAHTLVSVNGRAGITSSTIDVNGALLAGPAVVQCFGDAVTLTVAPLMPSAA